MFYDMGLVASNLFFTRIDQSLRQGKKKILTIQFQFVRYVYSKHVLLGKKYATHETHDAMRTMLKF
jgi:hypothetical protein